MSAPIAAAAPGSVDHAYVDHVEWAKWGDLSSLRVYPTDAARALTRQPGTAAEADQAWAEVLTLSPDADLPGMREQFLCHWTFAELAEPGKASWNLEPWRPQVSPEVMLASGCNPGGSEEPF
ncbi:DUF2599 domain-containing protein [Mycobacterium sp. CBMA247]|nr:DUF2599 domain-containing protein [Mycolicibacterium sp. CBMA 329]MUL87529.1 DUF2599 domain-containing protein [Mycolicibacterium sp. CBMA 331]MUL99607.1 DUF2599 domain-containing protein [Mycolicibacterium sp. CBMA 334]MUM26704.1 DUF2599 domain-containing protein [Mycolicibacterium sp. CBMA 295]MUM37826.1 DUF2599 domain-containing protein [Mycolicibacterium sp. CBMA 247]MUM43594.1 DUF2599 domain-containing protein [Mycolicibacterium sp. CBMA 294]